MCRKEQANQSTKEHRQCDPHYDPPLVDVAAEQNQIPSHENVTVDSQKLRQFVHFTGKKAMDIEELSEMTLETFIGRGLLTSLMDIYHLDQHRDAIVEMDGFEDEQFDRIWEAIQASRDTTFERYLIALDIPTIARMAGTRLCRQFGGSLDALEAAVDSGYDFAKLQGFGAAMHKNIHEWFEKEENRLVWRKLQQEVTIVPKA
jgi:DNA ligase (NAD+)